MKNVFNWLKSLFAKRCEHRFDSKKVTDLNISDKDIKCLLCDKSFRVINAKGNLKFFYLETEKLHTVIKIKILTLLILCMACGNNNEKQKPTQFITPPDNQWEVVGQQGHCTLYRKCVKVKSGCERVYWSVCEASSYSSSVSTQ